MASVADRPFLEWVLRFLAKQGVREAVLSTGYLAGVVQEHFQKNLVPGLTVHCIAEPRPLGTAGGFRHAAQSSGVTPDGWLVLNGDSLVFTDLRELAAKAGEPGVYGAMLALPVPDASRYGSLACNPSGDLVRFAEKRPGAGLISAGVYLLPPDGPSALPSDESLSFEQDVFPTWVAQGLKIRVLPVQAPFLDIGTEESLARAGEFIRSNAAHFRA
jgi:NDP-sugar pyrophosphorylase family protein